MSVPGVQPSLRGTALSRHRTSSVCNMSAEVMVPHYLESRDVSRGSRLSATSAPIMNSSEGDALKQYVETRSETDFYFVPPRDLPTLHFLGNSV